MDFNRSSGCHPGGGTGKDCDIDELDIMAEPYHQLIVVVSVISVVVSVVLLSAFTIS